MTDQIEARGISRIPTHHREMDTKDPERYPASDAEHDPHNDPIGGKKELAIKRLRFAYVFADPRAPEEMALAWRHDIGILLGEYVRLKAYSELLQSRDKEAAERETTARGAGRKAGIAEAAEVAREHDECGTQTGETVEHAVLALLDDARSARPAERADGEAERRELALNLVADAKHVIDDTTDEFTISADYMDRVVKALGFKSITDVQRELDPDGFAEAEREISALMSDGDAGPYEIDAERERGT